MDYKKVVENIRTELKDYIVKSKLKSLVLGISGGIDSTICAAIAKPVCDELGIPLIGRSINITESNKLDERERAIMVGETFCHNFKEVDLTQSFYNLSSEINSYEGDYTSENIKRNIELANIKCRLRMIFLYDVAHRYNGCTINTDNRTESSGCYTEKHGGGVAFYTKNGDEFDVSLLNYFWKTDVYKLSNLVASEFDVTSPEYKSIIDSINAQATDGLGVTDGGDLDQLGKNSYAEVDAVLIRYHELVNMNTLHSKEINELNDLMTDVVIKRHLAGSFKALLPYEFDKCKIFNGVV